MPVHSFMGEHQLQFARSVALSTTTEALPKPDVWPWIEEDFWPQGSVLLIYMLIGLVAGIASALLGIGSGVVIVPVLSGFLRVPLRRAIGISIVTVFGIVVVGVASESLFKENIRWTLALCLAVGAQVGVWIGGRVGPKVPEKVLRYAFIVILLFTAAKLAGFVPGEQSFGVLRAGQWLSPWVAVVLLLGVLAGILSVLLGIGGGVVVVPGLLFLIDGIGFRAARATSLAMIVPTAFTGMLVHIRQKNVLWRSVVPLLVPGLLGAVAGVILANVVSAIYLRQIIFPIFLCIMVVRLGMMR